MSTALLTIDDLADRLRTTRAALYCRYYRNKTSLPPQVDIPGEKRMMFNAGIVDDWIKNPSAYMPQPKRGPGRPRKLP